ncbi:hypothetical protein HAT91_00586 [Dickeya solani]|nr:hypothetical protein HAT91_00586 [Dickeya solani]
MVIKNRLTSCKEIIFYFYAHAIIHHTQNKSSRSIFFGMKISLYSYWFPSEFECSHIIFLGISVVRTFKPIYQHCDNYSYNN